MKHLKKKIGSPFFSLLGIFIIIYALCFQWQLHFSLGLGQDNLHDMTYGLLPAVGAIIVSLALYWKHLSLYAILPSAIVGVSWIMTGPFLSYNTLINSNTIYLNNIYDIYVGLYLFAILFCLSMMVTQYAPRRIGAFLSMLFHFIPFSVILLQWGYFYMYHSCITTTGALIIFQTGPAETLEYIHSLGFLNGILLLIGILAPFILFYYCQYRMPSLPDTKRFRLWTPLASLLLVIAPSLGALGEEIFPEAFPIRIFLDTQDYMNRSALYADNHTYKYAMLEAKQLTPAPYNDTIIVVIGESETRTLMNAFNPDHVPNTPWLTSEKSNPNFTLFNNVYACVWYTVPVLEHALTESNFYNNKEFNQSISIIDMAKKAGYKTYWFSNQGSVGVADTPITLVANTADVSEWVDKDLKESTHDEALLKFLEKVNPKEKNFIVLHLMGSHIEYRNRYPAEFQKFNDGKLNREADFDNTILYTDWILQHIYAYAQSHFNLDAMVYFSDHGSDPDIARQPDGASFKVLRIPMFLYLSPSYQQRNPEIQAAVKDHINSYFTNDLMYEFVCGILNIQSANYDPSMSFASPKWHMERKDLVTRFGQTSLLEDTEY